MVNLSIELEQKDEMKLMGRVVRASSVMNGASWGIAFDLTRTYSVKQGPKDAAIRGNLRKLSSQRQKVRTGLKT